MIKGRKVRNSMIFEGGINFKNYSAKNNVYLVKNVDLINLFIKY